MSKRLVSMILLCGAAISLSATARAERAHRIQALYDPAAHEVREGGNIVQGNALIPLNDGDAVTCRGMAVDLLPVTPYTTERMMVTFDSDREGYRSVRISGGALRLPGGDTRTRAAFPPFEPENDHFQRSAERTTRCDSRGDFEFSDVADGADFVVTAITLQSDRLPAGGSLKKRVSLRGGRTTRVVLAP